MTKYDIYLESLRILDRTIIESDNKGKALSRMQKSERDALERKWEVRISNLQAQARKAAEEYARTTMLLEARDLKPIGVQLPKRVRPVTRSVKVSVAEALEAQKLARINFEKSLHDYRTADSNLENTSDNARMALEARKAVLLSESKVEGAEPPVISTDPEINEPKQKAEQPKSVTISLLKSLPLKKTLILRKIRGNFAVVATSFAILGTVLLAALQGNLFLGLICCAVLILFALALYYLKLLSKSKGAGKTKPASVTPRPPHREPIISATSNGVMTGFEPQELDKFPIPTSPRMHGKPGALLSSSLFGEDNIKAGKKGEINFAKALQKAGLLERYSVFWSLHMLGGDSYSKTNTDIDCAIITGRKIWLIDLKYYASGDVTFMSSNGDSLITIDNQTGAKIGEPKHMSHQMKLAVERFRARYKNYKYPVEARIVLVPTNKGQGVVDGVRWPGGIPLVTLTDFLAELALDPNFVENLDSDLICRTFKALIQ